MAKEPYMVHINIPILLMDEANGMQPIGNDV